MRPLTLVVAASALLVAATGAQATISSCPPPKICQPGGGMPNPPLTSKTLAQLLKSGHAPAVAATPSTFRRVGS